jgi:hypothetical protein
VKPRQLLMGAGVVVAGWLAFFGDKTPSGTVAEPVVHANVKSDGKTASPANAPAVIPTPAATTDMATTGNSRKGKTKPAPTIDMLQPREQLIGSSGDFKQGDPLFASQSWVPPPPPPAKPVAPPPPTAPALPFTFIGKKLEDAAWEVYLSKDDHTFIVREHSVIDTNYRVESIKPPTLTLTYLPLNQMQTLTIGGAD